MPEPESFPDSALKRTDLLIDDTFTEVKQQAKAMGYSIITMKPDSVELLEGDVFDGKSVYCGSVYGAMKFLQGGSH